jgi:hypothetical protein
MDKFNSPGRLVQFSSPISRQLLSGEHKHVDIVSLFRGKCDAHGAPGAAEGLVIGGSNQDWKVLLVLLYEINRFFWF